jgi:acyl-CoA reductase-like NAD-dependent aldehyde dehydrogenase
VEATTSNTLASEEVFGPVMTLLKAKSEAHAIELANET